MNLVKKILVVHADAKMKRRIVLMLADAGYDTRAYTQCEPALETSRNEWFDLALVDAKLPGADEFEFVELLKKVQPTVPVILAVPSLELPLIVKGIRMGLSDVLPVASDLRPLLRRVNSLLRPNQLPANESEALSPAELAEAEAILQVIANPDPEQSHDPFNTPDIRQELMKGAKEKASLEAKTERLEHEKSALEGELKTLISQNADAARLQKEIEELRSQRESSSVAQSLIDQKARALIEARSELAQERTLLEEERKKLLQSSPITADTAKDAHLTAPTALETKKLTDWEARLREEESRIQHSTTQLAQERRRWHEDLDLMRDQENNLREYESRLRLLQAQLEADRVLWFSSRPQSRSPFNDDAAVKAAWEKLQRATELLEAERAIFKDERIAYREQEADIKRREVKLAEQSAKLSDQEKRLRSLPPFATSMQPFPSSSTQPPIAGSQPSTPTAPKSKSAVLSRTPFEIAKSLLGGRSKSEPTE